MSSHRLASDVVAITLVASTQSPTGPLTFPGDGDVAEILYAGVLGPSALLIYRCFLRVLRLTGGPVPIDVEDLAASVGVRRNTALRSIERLVDFHFASLEGSELAVRTTVPAPSSRLVERLSPSVRRFYLETVARATRAG